MSHEVETAGGAPVEEAPATLPEQAERDPGEGASERRSDADQSGREPDESGVGGDAR